jgi:hypothetical protein
LIDDLALPENHPSDPLADERKPLTELFEFAEELARVLGRLGDGFGEAQERHSLPDTIGRTALNEQRTPAAGDSPAAARPAAAPARRVPVDCGSFGIHIARDGTWWHDGTPFTRPKLVKLFATVLQRDEAGTYWLSTPAERGTITVEDAPFTAVELEPRGTGRKQILIFRTNIDDIVEAGADHPIRVAYDRASGEPSPYLLVRGRLEALLTRAVFYQLVELGAEEEFEGKARFGVWSRGTFFPLDEAPSGAPA